MQTKMKSLLPDPQEHPENRYFKILLWGFLGIFALGILAGTVTLFITLQGAEDTMIPNLKEMELVSALEELQSRGLNVRVQQRFDGDPELRGAVIEQRPDAGSQVRVGRTVQLIVSKGPVVDQVGDYLGLTLDDLRRQLAAQFATHESLLEVRNENISYIFSEEPQGTIISQEPQAGTKLSGYTDLKLLVSRGPEVLGFEAPETLGLDYRQALGLLAGRSIPFVFRYSSQEDDNSIPGLVVSQFPAAGETVEPDSPLVLRITPLEPESSNEISDIFYSFIPESALPVPVRVEFTSPEGDVTPYFQTTHSGGELSFPFVLEISSQITVYADGDIITRYTVQPETAEEEGEDGEAENNG